MSQPQFIVWPASSANTATIAPVQSLSAAGSLFLNTNTVPNNPLAFPLAMTPILPTTPTNPHGTYYYQGMARSLSITSAANLSALTVTITGLGSAVDGSGNPTNQLLNTELNETLAGPNNTTVYSVNIYKVITGISINGAATSISAGFGSFGITDYLFPDINRKGWYAQCSGQVVNHTSLTYSGYVSLNKPWIDTAVGGAWQAFPNGIPAFAITNMAAATTTVLQPLTQPVATIWWVVQSNVVGSANESVTFTFLQQGIS